MAGTTILFAILGVFMIWILWRKRRDAELRHRQELDEEPWSESLTDADIEEIYGPKQEDQR